MFVLNKHNNMLRKLNILYYTANKQESTGTKLLGRLVPVLS